MQKPCSRTPSHTRPASLSMSGPTAAIDTGIAGSPEGGGENSGVISVKR